MAEMIPILSFSPLSQTAVSFYYLGFHQQHKEFIVMQLAILAQMKARPGKEAEVEAFLKSALPLANQEAGTLTWFALKLGPSTYGIFDTFADEAGRDAHLSGPIAAALMKHADELLAEPPTIEKVQVLAAKVAA